MRGIFREWNFLRRRTLAPPLAYSEKGFVIEVRVRQRTPSKEQKCRYESTDRYSAAVFLPICSQSLFSRI
jgi:hypothetical protein